MAAETHRLFSNFSCRLELPLLRLPIYVVAECPFLNSIKGENAPDAVMSPAGRPRSGGVRGHRESPRSFAAEKSPVV
jgi:hypothetical protein